MKIVFIGVYANNSSTVVYGGDILSFHIFEALNDNFHCEPPGQNVSIVSQICLILVSNYLKRSQFYLKHVSDKMSQFGLNLRPFLHLRHN